MEPDVAGWGEFIGMFLSAVGAVEGGDPAPASVPVDTPAAEHLPIHLAFPNMALDVSPDQIRDVEAILDDITNMPALSIRFRTEATAWLAEATTQNVGQDMVVSVCGVEITAPRVQTPILTGSAMITGDFTPREIDAMVDVIEDRISCAAYLETINGK